MEFKKTGRGFGYYQFEDTYGHSYTIQESSSAEEERIWFGIDDAEPKIMASKTPQGGTGWVPYPIPEDVLLNTRMHLTRAQVKELLPILTSFVRTGNIRPEALKAVEEEPCSHPGCRSHVTHPCEVCGRQWGK